MNEHDAFIWSRQTSSIRERCEEILAQGEMGRLSHFQVDLSRLPETARFVLEVTRKAYPDLNIPYHSRWNHFRAGGVDRVQEFDAILAPLGVREQGRARFGLVVTSVLLDAGAGPAWSYQEPEGRSYSRSEGLAVASFHMFLQGVFSEDNAQKADIQGLLGLTVEEIARGFQASEENPMVGLEGRAGLMKALGNALTHAPHIFGRENPRVGGLFDFLYEQADSEGRLEAVNILEGVLSGLGSIWPGRLTLSGENLGDVWSHPLAGGQGRTKGLIPFHKLSQWLSYSLIEPLEQAGLQVVGVEKLTGLPEYRNGGLLVDMGVLKPKHEGVLRDAHLPGSEVIVEWRALTVALLDRIGDLVRDALQMSAADFPLAKVLEGGTWAAGRVLARERRKGGTPPIKILSDGTVF